MQAVQRFEREKRVDGEKKKEEVDDPHTSAAKQKRPLRIGAELLLAERPSCSCVAACIRHYFPRQGRRLEPRWRASRGAPLRGSLGAAYRSIEININNTNIKNEGVEKQVSPPPSEFYF